MNKILQYFSILHETEDCEIVIESIDKGVVFRGTNLWVLIFAILLASLGLNINSTAVIIGAMLISPLMGPIMGLGMGMGINDLSLFKKALVNYFLAIIIALSTSTLFFLLSPLNDAHSEILARIYPTLYDVLIAFCGGFAGIIASSSKQKGNVIAGVAIATALMPPLCTAGYGLATQHFNFFFGALYLFFINSVFIALATLITVRILKFPFKHLPDDKSETRVKRIITVLVLVTILPSIYFAYDIVTQKKFNDSANSFIEKEAIFKNDYLLSKKVDPKEKTIILTFGGRAISDSEINMVKAKMKSYNLDSNHFYIRQGFAYLNDHKDNEEIEQLTNAMEGMGNDLRVLRLRFDSIAQKDTLLKIAPQK